MSEGIHVLPVLLKDGQLLLLPQRSWERVGTAFQGPGTLAALKLPALQLSLAASPAEARKTIWA